MTGDFPNESRGHICNILGATEQFDHSHQTAYHDCQFVCHRSKIYVNHEDS